MKRLKILGKEDCQLLKRACQYIRPYKLKFLLAFLCILSGIGFGVVQPLLWAKVITSLFQKNFEQLLGLIGFLLALHVLETLMGFLQSYLFGYLNQNIIFDLKTSVYQKILDLPVKAFDELRVGDFIARVNGDATTIAQIITSELLSTFVDLLKVIIFAIVVFMLSVPLSLVVVMAFPFSYLVFVSFGKILREKNEAISSLNDGIISKIEQTIAGIREIKSLGVKKYQTQHFNNVTQEFKEKNIKIQIINTWLNTLAQSVNFVSEIAVISCGGYLIYKGQLKVEYFIAFTSYSAQFSNSLMNITELNTKLQQVLTSLRRIFELLDNLSYQKEIFGNQIIKRIMGRISFEEVSFAYLEGNLVLKEINLEIKPNCKVAIVGASGSGKTTLFNLLLRFYEPVSGRIELDGIPIQNFDEDSLRSQLAIVRQEPFLFNVPIRENLLMANPRASETVIIQACKLASIHDYIMRLPAGYDSIVEENGVNMSGGEKQRLAIARALLKNAKIILFDEATSSLDNESQHYIKKAINEIAKDHTVLIIAHRLATIIEADEIIVLNHGRIVGRGTHSRLIDTNRIYQRLYEAELKTIQAAK